MKILFFSDIHADWRALENLLAREADFYFCAGDLVSWSKNLDRAGEMLSQRAGRVQLIPGNHETADEIAQMAEKWGLESKHRQAWELGGVRFAALGYSNKTPFKTPGESTEEELASHLEGLAASKPDVLICHCPPANTALDRSGPGKHFGSPAVADAIERMKPSWFFCGHIHEAEGVESILGVTGQTRGINVGKRGFILDLTAIQTA